MAIQTDLAEVPAATRTSTGNPVGGQSPGFYPWDQWGNGAVWLLDPDKDFPYRTVPQFRAQAAVYALRYGRRVQRARPGKRIKVHTRYVPAEGLYVQFYECAD